MGSSQSTTVPGGGTEGYHVLRVQENSPGSSAGLQAYFDFIVSIGNTRLNQDNDALKEILKASIDRPVKMMVYNSKSQTVREVEITPSNTWGGQGLLGVSIRFCSFEGANEHVWHVLEVEPNSPAEKAGLQSNCDYIIGADSVLQESEDLFSLIEAHEGKPLKLFVYNLLTDCCREVTITPNSNWGGEGSLGCGIGYGYLHRIPRRPLDEVEFVSKAPPTNPSPAPAPAAMQTVQSQIPSHETHVNNASERMSNLQIGEKRGNETFAQGNKTVDTVLDRGTLLYTAPSNISVSVESITSVGTSSQSSGTFVTPLTLPGMPPITVTATLPSELSLSSLGINFQNPPQPPSFNPQPQYSWQQPYNYQMPVSTYGQPSNSTTTRMQTTSVSVPNSQV
ncbi:Golgi reassembly-stacking protein 2-like protein [Dinothrombium tinctorium]|uniref:Golgi reassembly-stacking protein 2-like protein n=1 Tax=Dinothrombium tinctorium TaxID=1965070 RepID=A0A443RKK7_9ACAR|nr:Golgi reassembly-stacking protein 2-like protein [Dinothrombium tinctorium]